MKFNIAYKKGSRISIKVTSEGKEIWMGCSESVYNWCKKNFKEGDEIDVTYTEKNGQYTATRAVKKGYNNAPPAEKATPKAKGTNDTPPVKSGQFAYPRDYMKSKNPEESAQIRALSILSSVCHAVPTMTGQVDLNSLGDFVEALYDRFDKKLP